MAEDIKAEASIELEISSLQSSSKEIQKEFKNVEKAADSSLKNVDKSIEDVGDEATKTGNKIKDAGSKGEQAFDKLGDAAEETKRDAAALGIEIIGLAQGFGGISDAIFGANEQLVKIQRSAFGVETTVKDLRIEIEDFRIALAAGELSTLSMNRALEAITFTYKDLKIQQLEAKTEQESLNSAFINMGLSIGQTVALSVITLQTAFDGMTKAQIASKFATIANSNAMKALGFNFQGAAAAMKGATFSLSGFRAGIRATMLALGPIGITMIGIGAAFEIWQTNAFGVQERMAELWETLRNMFPILQALEQVVSTIFPAASEDVDEFGTSLEFAGKTTEELLEKLDSGEITMEQFAAAVRASNDELGTMTNILQENVKTGLSETNNELEISTLKFTGFKDAVKGASAELESFKKKRPLDEINAGLETAARNIVSLTSAKIEALQKTILAANLLGIGGGNVFTLTNSLDGINIKGSNNPLTEIAKSLRLTRDVFGHIDSNISFGHTSSFASSFGGGPAFSTFGTSRSDFGRPSAPSFSQSGTSAHRTASGTSSKHGASNLTVKFNLFAEERRLNNELLGMTGLSLQQLQSITGLDLFNEDVYGAAGRTALSGNWGSYTRYQAAQVARGQLQAARAKAAENNRAEVQTRVALAEQLVQLDPVQFPSFQALLKVNSETLRSLLANENSEISGISNLTNLSSNEIVALRQTEQGRLDISGISLYMKRTQKEMLISTTV